MTLLKDGSFEYLTETHYDQLDGQMVLHHPSYFIFVERAQQFWFESVLNAPRFDWRNYPDMYLVVRKIEAEYLRPIDGVVPIRVIIWPESIRAAKLKMGFKIECPDSGIVFCKGSRLNCKVDIETHEPRMWSDKLRVAVDGFLAQRNGC